MLFIYWLENNPQYAKRVGTIRARMEERGDQLIEFKLRVERRASVERAHIDAAAFAKLQPAAPCQIAISGADRVRVDVITACQLARRRQTRARQ